MGLSGKKALCIKVLGEPLSPVPFYIPMQTHKGENCMILKPKYPIFKKSYVKIGGYKRILITTPRGLVMKYQ